MRTPEQPLRFTVTPGAVVAHAGHTVVIREIVDSTHVQVRDVATGSISFVQLLVVGTVRRVIERNTLARSTEDTRIVVARPHNPVSVTCNDITISNSRS